MNAVVGNGSWGGASKVHAERPGSGVYLKHSSEERFTSLCGLPYLTAYKGAEGQVKFEAVLHLAQCQRCVRLAAAREQV